MLHTSVYANVSLQLGRLAEGFLAGLAFVRGGLVPQTRSLWVVGGHVLPQVAAPLERLPAFL